MNASPANPDPGLLDRARGCAVGAAIGDALGMPLEARPPRPLNHLLREMVSGRLPAGSFTDDTEMALALAESLLARLRRGDPWDVAAEAVQAMNRESAPNGSLMRCWPAALAYWDDPDALLRDSVLQSRVTHVHIDCLAACAFANTLIAALLRGTAPAEAVSEALATVPLPDGLRVVVEGAASRRREELPNTGWVRHTLESALWGLLTTGSFEEALVQVVNLGHDADSAGAVAGALAGAAYGLAAIPARWRTALCGAWPPRSETFWTADDFAALADRLVGAVA
ncbi:MAG: ADP-ribosylglycohydrolase family protein [Chloroflexota bacterium]|jgi:ADP-ribosyl-[dinitrogen reductase] hydrolase